MLPMINSKAEYTQTGEAMKEKDTQSTFFIRNNRKIK